MIPPVEYYIPTVELFGNFAKPCMDLSSPRACGSSTLPVLPHHLGLNAINLVKTPYHSLSKGFNDMNANTKCSSGATVLIQCLSQM